MDLSHSQQCRKDTIEKYNIFINDMILNKPKGIRYRTWFRNYLLNGADTLFDTEEDEYHYINKFGRGAWEETRLRRTFNKKEMEIVIQIADGYGAFDY